MDRAKPSSDALKVKGLIMDRKKTKEATYTKEDFINLEFFDGDPEVKCKRVRLSTLRAPKVCYACGRTIRKGEVSRVETALVHAKWGRCDVCQPCLVDFLDKITD